MDEIILRLNRTLNAPPKAVFEAFKKSADWWCPEGMTCVSSLCDFRVGGKFRFGMAPDNTKQPIFVRGEYLEIEPYSRLIFTHIFEHHEHWVETELIDCETVVTIELIEHGDKTELSFIQKAFRSSSDRDRMRKGWPGIFKSLDVHLTTRKDV